MSDVELSLLFGPWAGWEQLENLLGNNEMRLAALRESKGGNGAEKSFFYRISKFFGISRIDGRADGKWCERVQMGTVFSLLLR